jgi:hypothetical protein
LGSAGAAGWLCRAQCAAAAGLAVSGACDACHAPWRRPSSKLGAQDQASQVGGGGGVRVYAAAVRWPWAIIRSASPVARKPCRRATPATRPSAPPAKPRNCSRSAAARSAAARSAAARRTGERTGEPSAAAGGKHHPRGWALATFRSVALAYLSLLPRSSRSLSTSLPRSLVLSFFRCLLFTHIRGSRAVSVGSAASGARRTATSPAAGSSAPSAWRAAPSGKGHSRQGHSRKELRRGLRRYSWWRLPGPCEAAHF